MKKIKILFLIILTSTFLVGCDYPEKSFNALNEYEIPVEVTRSFVLPKGIYGKFIWTTDNDAIIVNEYEAIVNQKDEDTLVTLTATIKNTSKSFKIVVYKKGSELSNREKCEDIIEYFKATYVEIDGNHLAMPKYYDGFYLKYNLNDRISFYEDEDSIYLSSGFNAFSQIEDIYISFYPNENYDYNEIIYRSSFGILTHKLKSDDIYIKTLDEININDYQKSFKFNFYLEPNDYIEFSSHETYDIKLSFFSDETFKKISDTKYQMIKPIEDTLYLKGYLTITIDKMPKEILITVYNKES